MNNILSREQVEKIRDENGPADDLQMLCAHSLALLDGIGNLLAIIHRDGGHYIERHGLEKAIEDGKQLSCGRNLLLDENAALKAECERMRKESDAKDTELTKAISWMSRMHNFIPVDDEMCPLYSQWEDMLVEGGDGNIEGAGQTMYKALYPNKFKSQETPAHER